MVGRGSQRSLSLPPSPAIVTLPHIVRGRLLVTTQESGWERTLEKVHHVQIFFAYILLVHTTSLHCMVGNYYLYLTQTGENLPQATRLTSDDVRLLSFRALSASSCCLSNKYEGLITSSKPVSLHLFSAPRQIAPRPVKNEHDASLCPGSVFSLTSPSNHFNTIQISSCWTTSCMVDGESFQLSSSHSNIIFI